MGIIEIINKSLLELVWGENFSMIISFLLSLFFMTITGYILLYRYYKKHMICFSGQELEVVDIFEIIIKHSLLALIIFIGSVAFFHTILNAPLYIPLFFLGIILIAVPYFIMIRKIIKKSRNQEGKAQDGQED